MPELNNVDQLRKWFRQCPALSDDNRFRVDYLSESPTEYAIYASPSTITYRENVLVPSLRGIRADGKSFLRAMASTLDSEGVARIADVAEAMDKTTKQLSTCRQMLIARRLILPVARGKICYGLPYLQRYSLEGDVPEMFDFTNRWIPR